MFPGPHAHGLFCSPALVACALHTTPLRPSAAVFCAVCAMMPVVLLVSRHVCLFVFFLVITCLGRALRFGPLRPAACAVLAEPFADDVGQGRGMHGVRVFSRPSENAAVPQDFSAVFAARASLLCRPSACACLLVLAAPFYAVSHSLRGFAKTQRRVWDALQTQRPIDNPTAYPRVCPHRFPALSACASSCSASCEECDARRQPRARLRRSRNRVLCSCDTDPVALLVTLTPRRNACVFILLQEHAA